VIVGFGTWGDANAKKQALKNAGQVVGYLAYETDQFSGRRQDRQFNQTVAKLLWVIAGVMILLALLITLPVARYFTRPIQALNQATKKAAAGDYAVRTHIQRNDELGQLGQNFNLLTQTLESNATVQKKMMADISHELRTPVAVLLAQIEALQDGIYQADEKNLSLLHGQTTTLQRLINDLHQLSVTDLGSMQYQMLAINLNQVIDAVIDGQRILAEKQHIDIQQNLSDQDLFVLGDGTRLHQLFTNLINNAIKYTDASGQVVISSSLDVKQDEVVVKIEDSAPGLLPHERQQMFDRLYRQETSRNKKQGGSGLGLTIAKNIVEAHQGQILAEDSDLGGVCLIVRIPNYV
jgi:two-component system sensor histidine kinase BaeS